MWFLRFYINIFISIPSDNITDWLHDWKHVVVNSFVFYLVYEIRIAYMLIHTLFDTFSITFNLISWLLPFGFNWLQFYNAVHSVVWSRNWRKIDERLSRYVKKIGTNLFCRRMIAYLLDTVFCNSVCIKKFKKNNINLCVRPKM